MSGINLKSVAESLSMKNLTPGILLEEIPIRSMEVNRAGIQLTGYFEHFDSSRIQILGKVEQSYLLSKPEEQRVRILDELFSRGIPALAVTRNFIPSETLLGCAWRHNVPVLATEMGTSAFQAKLIRVLEMELAPSTAIHGVLVDVFGEGVLITGESGIGKSEVALELIKRGHRLVADDSVELKLFSESELYGMAPEVTQNLMELRGVGVIDVKALFGVESVKDEMRVSMVIRLEDWARDKQFDRLGMKEEFVDYLGCRIPCYRVPVSPGRNVAIIVETASINFRQKRMGYDAYKELERRIAENMRRNTEEE